MCASLPRLVTVVAAHLWRERAEIETPARGRGSRLVAPLVSPLSVGSSPDLQSRTRRVAPIRFSSTRFPSSAQAEARKPEAEQRERAGLRDSLSREGDLTRVGRIARTGGSPFHLDDVPTRHEAQED